MSERPRPSKTYNVCAVVVPLCAGVDQQIQLALQRRIVIHVVKSSRSLAGREDRVVGHLLGAIGDAGLEECGLKLQLRLGRLGLLHDVLVAPARDLVGLAQLSNLVFVLDHTGSRNALLENGQVLLRKGRQRDVVGDLVLDTVDGAAGVGRAQAGQHRADLVGIFHLVDVVLCLGVFGRQRETGPDDIVGVDGGNEEGRFVRLDIVDVIGVGEVAAGEVVKVSALAADEDMVSLRDAIRSCAGSRLLPEGLGRVIILANLGHATLEVEDAIGIGHFLADELEDSLGMGIAGVFALEHGVKVFGDHGGRRSGAEISTAGPAVG
jgi:hypothetical protein